MKPDPNPRSMEDLVAEGNRLIEARPFCAKMMNDLTAATLLSKLHAQGDAVSYDSVDQCVRRMRIAVDTGIYPHELLRKIALESIGGSPLGGGSDDSHGQRILVVDDDPLTLRIITICLEKAGHRVTVAKDGLDAMQSFVPGSIDIVITDRNMPGMGGEQMALELRRIDPALPIILISGQLPEILDPARFSLMLAKPFKGAALLKAIEEFTSKEQLDAVPSNASSGE